MKRVALYPERPAARHVAARARRKHRVGYDAGHGSFELVWASEVIEHVADTARWLSEVRRVLVPGGPLLVTTPSHGRLRVALAGVDRVSEPLGDHFHLYTRRSLQTLLGEFGFGQISIRAAGGPPLLRRLLLARAVR